MANLRILYWLEDSVEVAAMSLISCRPLKTTWESGERESIYTWIQKLNRFNKLFILIPQILFQLFCEWPWISACIWINKCISRNDKQIWWMWRRLLFHHKWDNYLTILPRQLPGQRRLHLHHLTAHRHCHPAEYSQHRYTNMHIQLVQPMYLWLSRDQRWPFSWFISSGQTVWQWDPCSHSVQPEPTLDEARRNISSKMSVSKLNL